MESKAPPAAAKFRPKLCWLGSDKIRTSLRAATSIGNQFERQWLVPGIKRVSVVFAEWWMIVIIRHQFQFKRPATRSNNNHIYLHRLLWLGNWILSARPSMLMYNLPEIPITRHVQSKVFFWLRSINELHSPPHLIAVRQQCPSHQDNILSLLTVARHRWQIQINCCYWFGSFRVYFILTRKSISR